MDKKLKNVSLHIVSNSFGNISVNVEKKNKEGKFEHIGNYKFDRIIENVDVELSVPKGCRTLYAKIIKI